MTRKPSQEGLLFYLFSFQSLLRRFSSHLFIFYIDYLQALTHILAIYLLLIMKSWGTSLLTNVSDY